MLFRQHLKQSQNVTQHTLEFRKVIRMKIILAIVQDKDSNRLANEFIDANIRATKLSSTGGFLKAGNSTFIVGIDDDRVEEALELIKQTCQSRKQYVSTPVTLDITMDGQVPYPVEVEVGGATVFVLPVEGFHQY
jgi:uncharacterized protein YaaQ